MRKRTSRRQGRSFLRRVAENVSENHLPDLRACVIVKTSKEKLGDMNKSIEKRDDYNTSIAQDTPVRHLVHELVRRTQAVREYDNYILNAEGDQDLTEFWQGLKRQEFENLRRLRELVSTRVSTGSSHMPAGFCGSIRTDARSQQIGH
jgi:hypothetical protein